MVLHITVIDTNGILWHTARRPDGTWLAFTNVRRDVLTLNPGSPDPGTFEDIACSGVGNDLHISATTAAGDVVHTIRTIAGARMPYPFPFGDVRGAAQAPRGTVWSLATAGVGTRGTLDVCLALQTRSRQLVSIDQSLFRAVRLATGPWRKFENRGGSFSDVACAIAGSAFHFCGVTFNSQGLPMDKLEHAVGSYGSSLTFGDAGAQVIQENPGSLNPGVFHRVSCAGSDDSSLHICTLSRGSLFHTIRRPNGTWFPFGDVVSVVVGGNPGSPAPAALASVGCAIVNGELHLVCVDGAGAVWHTIRRANGSWFPFGNVVGVATAQNPGTPNPGTIASVAVADSF